MRFKVWQQSVESVAILVCEGRLVFGPECEGFSRAADDALLQSTELVVDLRRVSFLDDHGLGAVLMLVRHARERGGDVRLVLPGTRSLVNRVIEVTKVGNIVRTFSNDMDAVGSYTEMFSRSIAV
ncbi:MAG: STAS domain-containing protein [Acidobacteriales bacterium]|nr:STAS domain-containing protein [Terriglobales bacterium]